MKSLGFFSFLFLGGCVSCVERGLCVARQTRVDHAELLVDETWTNESGARLVNQEIFARVYEMIERADSFVLLDMFLLNDFGYQQSSCVHRLSADFVDALLKKREVAPAVDIIFITDPLNTVYGSIESDYFKAMEQAGIQVVWTDLNELRDSNFLYSKFWRLCIKPFGLGRGGVFKNPMGEGRISVRSLLKLLNLKANHRKLILTDKELLVTSANPHSASCAHWNTALWVKGAGLSMVWNSESAIMKLSGVDHLKSPVFKEENNLSDNRLDLLTERRIKEKALEMLSDLPVGSRVDLSMFYFSDIELRRAFISAKKKGADVRVILDPAKEAFGRKKRGIPNRQTALALVDEGISLRWANTHGEQCHTKMLYVERGNGEATLLLGSGNYTRRNMENFNAECDLALTAATNHAVMQKARACFDRWWSNANDYPFTVSYEVYEDRSLYRYFAAWFKEISGMGTF